jgi:NAD(P)-dependent dehydrogenase (short-subunit alcohol dehydrogenase family)
MIKDFKGKTAYITGGGSGIGLSMARAFGRQGMNIVLADIDEAAAKAAAERLTSEQIKAKGVHVDVGDRNSVRASALEAVSAFGKVHIVCNNAGVAVGGMFGMMKERDWDWIIDVNLKGVVYGAETFVPLIKSHGEGGHMINTASVAGMISGPGLEPYSATKYAVVAMSEGWALQLSAENIGVSVLCPGFVRTRIHESNRARQDRYGGVNAEVDPGIAATRDMASQAVLSGIDPDVVGARVVEAVKNGELYIFTHPTMRPVIEMRLAAIRAGLDACDNSEALKGVKDFGGGSAFLSGQQ